MDELIRINYDSERPTVNGRDLHEALQVKTAYKDWFPRMCEYGFVEGRDFCSFLSESSGGRPAVNHQLTIDMAKQLCMIQRTDIGRKFRQYFIQVEEAWNSPEAIMANGYAVKQYAIAWCCATHLTDKSICSMKYITDDALKRAFVTMMNKLVFGHQIVLRPLLQSLRGMNDKSQLLKMQDLESQIEKNMEQRQVLTSLMAGGYLEPALFNKESNALATEAEALRQEKDSLMHSLNGNMVKADELQKLLRFVSRGIMMDSFDDEAFLTYVDSITIHSRSEAVFELKCGVSLKERLVD